MVNSSNIIHSKTRTLFVTGLTNEEQYNEFINALPEDSVLEHYVVPNTFLIFVTFFDVRKAIDFHTNVNNKILGNLQSEFTISKNELPEEDLIERANQASIIIHYKNCDDAYSADILDLVKSCGEIRECRMEKPGQRIYEYFDIRSAKKALESLNIADWKGGSVKVRSVWDIMPHVRTGILNRTDEIIKEELREMDIEITDTVKKLKVSKSKAESKNIFLEKFDDFILDNLTKIEKLIQNSTSGNWRNK